MSDENKNLEKSQNAIQNKLSNMRDNSLFNRFKALERCILIDGSSSMLDTLPDGTNRYTVVKKVHKEHLQTLEMRMFNFNDGFEEIIRGKIKDQEDEWGTKIKDPSEIPFPCGGTDMTNAFQEMKKLGVKKCIIVTDGQPNNAEEALKEAEGLQFDIVYIGEPPIPQFLLDLGNMKGNSVQAVDKISAGSFKVKELGDKIKGLLGEKK